MLRRKELFSRSWSNSAKARVSITRATGWPRGSAFSWKCRASTNIRYYTTEVNLINLSVIISRPPIQAGRKPYFAFCRGSLRGGCSARPALQCGEDRARQNLHVLEHPPDSREDRDLAHRRRLAGPLFSIWQARLRDPSQTGWRVCSDIRRPPTVCRVSRRDPDPFSNSNAVSTIDRGAYRAWDRQS
jgi:hypothetical protein